MGFMFRILIGFMFFSLGPIWPNQAVFAAQARSISPVADLNSSEPWLEDVRAYALRMIDEAELNSVLSDERFLFQALPQLRSELQTVFLRETKQIYAYELGLNRNIYLNPALARGPIELAASVLLHEGGHLLGDDECAAEARSSFVSKHSFLSHGLLMFGYLRQCLNLRERICGQPVFIQWPENKFDFDHSGRNALKKRLKNLTDYSKDNNIPFFFANRASGWVGGDSVCLSQIEGDFNQELKVSYAEFFQKLMRPKVVRYFTEKRQVELDHLLEVLSK